MNKIINLNNRQDKDFNSKDKEIVDELIQLLSDVIDHDSRKAETREDDESHHHISKKSNNVTHIDDYRS